jgi:hypothetical protein
MRESGKTYRAIADRLNKDGVPTLRTANRWTVSGVRGAAGYKAPRARKKAAVLPTVGRGDRSKVRGGR